MRRIFLLLMSIALVASACGGSSVDDTSSYEDEATTEDTSASDKDGTDTTEIETVEEDSRAEDAMDEEAFDDAVGSEAMAEPASGIVAPDSDIDPDPIEPPIDPPVDILPGTLTAAEVDDNLNFAFFQDYMSRSVQEFGEVWPSMSLSDRVALNVNGSDGAGLGNARIEVVGGDASATIYTNSAGTAYLFPSLSGLSSGAALTASVTDPLSGATQGFVLTGEANQSLTFDGSQGVTPDGMDVALVLDVTGSMADELDYLTVEFESIITRVSETYPTRDLRFALVVYRDEGDDFVTRTFDFTGDVAQMKQQLAEQSADGGGDEPEAMDQALAEANGLSWRDGNVARVMILNADAPPHNRDLDATLAEVAIARSNGVRIYPLAASGVADTAEYMMRVMAATTGGRHLFLTNDSGVGNSHQEPKTQCYVVTQLDQLLVRVLESELSGERIEAHSDQIIRTVGNYDSGVCSEQ